uniref:OSJNBa0041M21.12 protein n=1 Tax=Oryza sativa subsp. japonica TaxID=39947 RepID=Q7X7S0_ORYSJ|nr:OSJNBa0093P23.7 [Oryza sativa Japonica Group]CAD40454.2 OSJNBa0041M21.12 [Oryza sativa Japonica Group]
MDLGKSSSTSASLKKLQEDGALPGRGTMEREAGCTEPQPVLGRMVAIEDYILCGFLPPPSEILLLILNFYGLSLLHLNPNSIAFLSIFSHLCEAHIGEQPDKISSWTAKPLLTPSLQSFIDVVDDLRVRGLSSEAVGHRVGQVMISGPTTTSNVPVPLCEKGAAERDDAINVAVSLKEKVAKEASDAAAVAATTSGGDVPTKGRKFSSVTGHRRKASTPSPSRRAARAKAAQDESGGTSGASPAVASTSVVVVPGSREVTPSGPASDPVAGRGPPAAVLTWEELQVEMGRLLEAGGRGIGREIAEARDVDDENVQQRGQPESLAIIPTLAFEPHASPDDVDQSLATRTGTATTSLDLESALAGKDHRIQYWKTKFEVAELERTMLEVKKEQAVETLRGREVWFNSYLKSCCTSMAKDLTRPYRLWASPAEDPLGSSEALSRRRKGT